MQHDISAFEEKLRRLDQSMNALATAKHAEKLTAIVHRPGFTTIAEVQLMHAMMDALQHQVDGLHRTHDALLAAANHVGKQ